MTRRPDQRPNDNQLASVETELIDIIRRLVAAYPILERQAREWSPGFSSSSISGSRGSDIADPVAQAVEAREAGRYDPSEEAQAWVDRFNPLVKTLQAYDRTARNLLPLTEAEVEKARERKNTVAVCPSCESPIVPPVDTPKRLDDDVYHAGACWWQGYNKTRGRRPAESESA